MVQAGDRDTADRDTEDLVTEDRVGAIWHLLA